MNKLVLVCLGCLMMLVSSCGVTNNATHNTNITQTQVVLAQKNFRIVGTVSGEISQGYFLGLIGGLTNKALRESAMSEMYKNAHLTGAQAIINVNISYKAKYFIVYSEVTAIATGTIIEFVDSQDECGEIKCDSTSGIKVSDISPSTDIDVTRVSTLSKRLEEAPSAQIAPSKESEVKPESDPNAEQEYQITYLKRRSRGQWETVKEERKILTPERVKEKAKAWESQSTDFVIYKCQYCLSY